MTTKALEELVEYLEGVYDREFSEKQIRAWGKTFENHDGENGEIYPMAAAYEWVTSGNHFPPNPADLCALVNRYEEGDEECRALLKRWEEEDKECRLALKEAE